MKFLLIAGSPFSILHFRGALIDALIRAGFVVHVAAPDLPDDSLIYLRLREKGLVVHHLPIQRTGMNPIADIWVFIRMLWLFLVVRPDFFMGYTIKPVIYGLLAARLAFVPRRFALITGLGYAFQDGHDGTNDRRGVRRLVQNLYGLALRGAHKVFFQNPDDEALFRGLGILTGNSSSFVVNGSGVSITEYAMTPIPETMNFLLIGRLLGDKGIREYAAASKRLRALYPDVIFGLAGPFDSNPSAISQAEIDGWVREGVLQFYGSLEDVRPAIAACTVYVLPSYREGTPRTVLEAMAMGRPIVTTDAPGCRETVIDGDNGYLVAVKSVDELAAAMERFIVSPELVIRMGKRSREIAESKYDVNAVNAVMLREIGITGNVK